MTENNNTSNNKNEQNLAIVHDKPAEDYHNTLVGLSLGSFLIGISTALYVSRKQLFSKSKTQFNPDKHLPLPIPKNSMNQARRFALQTFAVGTCISLGGFGVFLLTMSKLTGTTNLKDFSQYMKDFIGDELKPKLQSFGSSKEAEEDKKLEKEVSEVIDTGLKSMWNAANNDAKITEEVKESK